MTKATDLFENVLHVRYHVSENGVKLICLSGEETVQIKNLTLLIRNSEIIFAGE